MIKKNIIQVLLFTVIAFLYTYFLEYGLYLLLLSVIANLSFLVRNIHLDKASKVIEILDIIAIICSGLFCLLSIITSPYIQQHNTNFKHRKLLIYLLVFLCCVPIGLFFSAYPIIASLNLLLLVFNILHSLNFYVYYYFTPKKYFSLSNLCAKPSPNFQKKLAWVVSQFITPKNKLPDAAIYAFWTTYIQQYNLFTQKQAPEKADMEVFIWEVLEKPVWQTCTPALPIESILFLLTNKNWVLTLAQKSQDSPALFNWFVFIVKNWVAFLNLFIEKPNANLAKIFKFDGFKETIETYLEKIPPLLEKNPELREHFQYACSLSFVGIGMAANMD
jgi:hypothetical protein